MSDIPILPNPFKMLDLEREKKMKSMDDKCNSCDDEKKEGFNNLKKDNPIIEGMEQDEEGKWFAVVMFVGALIMVLTIWVIFRNKSKENIIAFYSEYYVKFIMLVFFIVFAFISLFLHTNDLGNITNNTERINNKLGQPYVWIPIVVGLIMFALRFIPGTDNVPALIGYFENTVGHIWFLVFSLFNEGLNKWIRSDNFETLTAKNGGSVTNDFNPLMSRFNLNNYDEIIAQMRFDNDTNNKNENESSDFFVTLNHKDGQKTQEDFINYIKEQVILKRAWGEVTLLILTTLISTGVLQSVYH